MTVYENFKDGEGIVGTNQRTLTRQVVCHANLAMVDHIRDVGELNLTDFHSRDCVNCENRAKTRRGSKMDTRLVGIFVPVRFISITAWFGDCFVLWPADVATTKTSGGRFHRLHLIQCAAKLTANGIAG